MTTWANIQSEILQACRQTNVSGIAGVAASVWADSNEGVGHVFAGRRGYIGGRNRGRLPFIEVFKRGVQEFRSEARTDGELGGTLNTQFTIRVHTNHLYPDEAEQFIDTMVSQILTNVRSTDSDNYMDLGNDSVTEIFASPVGHYKDIEGNVEHTFERDGFED